MRQNKRTMLYLRNFGCEKAQGFFFAKPMPAREFEAWLKERITLPA